MYTLLIVEDEELVRTGIRRLVPFEQFGITTILEAGDGEEGLRLFLAHHPDLILLDINVPRLNGLEFAAKAKEREPRVKIAIITGYDYYDYAVTALKLGIDDYVLKPVSRSDVSEMLRKLVEKLHEDRRQSELHQVAEGLVTTRANPDDVDQKSKILRQVENNIGNPGYSLAALAEHQGFSPGYMSVLFKRLFHVAFQDYLLSARLERAKLQLLMTDLKMYEIAASLGFDNPNYFSAAFKKRFGLSPLQYRERTKHS